MFDTFVVVVPVLLMTKLIWLVWPMAVGLNMTAVLFAPSVVVLVATVQALKHHGGDPDGGLPALERGFDNLRAALGIVRRFGLNCVVAINRFPRDEAAEIDAAKHLANELGAQGVAVNEGFELGGAGTTDKKKVRDALAATNVDTFYGPVKFGPTGMNQARELPIIQVQDKAIKVLLPADIKSGEMVLIK